MGSCARTDAKPIDRDVMMKYDIAKNEEGPLRRTTNANVNANTSDKASTLETAKGKTSEGVNPESGVGVGEDGKAVVTAERYPPLHERLQNLETHLAVRYGVLYSSTLHSRYSQQYLVTIQCVYSTVASSIFIISSAVPRRAYHKIRKRSPALGSFALQSASPWCE